MNFNITQNFARIYRTIGDQGIKRTAFAKAMGYSSTAQLSSTLDGEALISTKAVIELVKNFNVNPTYLFTGQGPMFMAEKDEIDELKEQIRKLEQDKNEMAKTVLKLNEMVKTLEERNANLIDLTAIAMRNIKKEGEKEERKETTENK
jgi:transcriptional regulator with XRE-family HTH domain